MCGGHTLWGEIMIRGIYATILLLVIIGCGAAALYILGHNLIVMWLN